MKNNGLRAVIYARYSSSNQREESIEAQIRVCADYAKKKGYEIVNEYSDRALTGKSDKRPAFQQMIEDSDKKKFDVLVVYKTDRFARNKYDSAIYKTRLKKNNVQIEYAAEVIPNTPEGVIMEGLLESFAEYYSSNLGVVTKRGKYENALKRKSNGGVTPIGYARNEEGNFVVDEPKAQVVRFIFESYVQNRSYSQIIKDVRDRHCVKVTMSGLKCILQNETYTGKYIYRTNDGEVFTYEDNHEAIIQEELFQKAQLKRIENKRSPNAGKGKKRYTLSGLAKCGLCGSSMIVTHSYKNGEPIYFRLGCLRRKEQKDCLNPTIKMDTVEDAVLNCLKRKVLNPDLIHDLAVKASEVQDDGTQDRLRELQTDLGNVQKAKNNLMTAIEMGIFTPTTKQRLEELERKESELGAEISRERFNRKETLTAEQIESFLRHYCGGDMEDESFRYELAHTFVKSVLIHDRKLVVKMAVAETEIVEEISL